MKSEPKSIVVEIVPCPHCKGTGTIVKKKFHKSLAWAQAIHRRTGKWPRGWVHPEIGMPL